MFKKTRDRKAELISYGLDSLMENEYDEFVLEYSKVLEDSKLELKKDYKTNAYRDDERKLIDRLIKYARNHLLFLKKFFVPFSNNRAESDLRGIKIKQKTEKFRSEEGAKAYAIIKSCLSTFTKNNKNSFVALQDILNLKEITI